MRRALFGTATEAELRAPARALVREALLFDVQDHQDGVDLILAERRLASWTLAPWLMFSGHLVLAISLLFGRPLSDAGSLGTAAIPLAAAVLLDAAAALMLLIGKRLAM